MSDTRWVAHPPPGLGPQPRVRRLRWPYSGPPSYGRAHPTWGFPPVARLRGGRPDGESIVAPRATGLAAAAVLCCGTAFAACAAAVAETWRYALLLRGRTLVLGAAEVRASDLAVQFGGALALLLGLAAAVAVTGAVGSLARAAAYRGGRLPPRSAEQIAARLLVPGWNLYGAGQVLVETFRLVHGSGSPGAADDGRVPPPARRLLIAWWAAWWANGVIAVAALAISFGTSNQLRADAVQWHIAVDVAAAVVAALSTAVLLSLRRAWRGRSVRRYRDWNVAPPRSTAENRTARTDRITSRAFVDDAAHDHDAVLAETPSTGPAPAGGPGELRKPSEPGTPAPAGERDSLLADAGTHTGKHRRR
ncbi:MAG: DUF4328 domain-containing protein [Actinobacteria bacterium]|nr:DUF4328 domain-containing protein [Actinomycetota bacterium]